MLLDHRLHPSLRIAAGATEILAGVVDFVLVERELRLGEVESIGRAIARSTGSPWRAAAVSVLHLRVVGRERAQRLLQLGFDLLGLGRERARLVRRLANRLREREIHLLIPEA